MIFFKKILKKSNFISFQLQFLSQFIYLFLENSPNFSVIAALFLCLFPMIPSGLSTKLDNNSFNASHGTKLSVHWQSFRNTKSSREQTWISVWSALTIWRVFSIKGTQKLINVNLFRRSAETGIGLWLGTYRLQFWHGKTEDSWHFIKLSEIHVKFVFDSIGQLTSDSNRQYLW